MSTSLAQSKFHVPKLRSNFISRPRLLRLLNMGLAKRLIIVSAPAGFGKSSLLSDWLQAGSIRYAWLSLDVNDNDYARFLSYFVAALQKLEPGIDNTVRDLLHSPQPALHSAALTALLNQIETIRGSAILVLDDFHTITNPQIHQTVEYLLNYLPDNMHLVLSTRSDPAISFSRLRAQGELIEVRMNDLKFTHEEVKQLFSQESEFQISDASISKLSERTEGWVSGLQMASLSLRGREDIEAFIQAFSGSHKFIIDYLFEEVLDQQPEGIQKFLHSTAVLERMSGSLCDAVLGVKNSQAVLEDLERGNLFLISLDDERRWFRYHQLFKDLLIHRLNLESPEQITGLYKEASIWHEEEGELSLAITYALEAEDFDRALRLILLEAEHALMRGEVNTLESWISRLPEVLIQGNAEIEFLKMWASILRGADSESALKSFMAADTDSLTSGRGEALKAFLHVSAGRFSEAGQCAQKALAALPPGEDYFRGLAVWILGIYHALQQDVPGAVKGLEELSNSLDSYKNPLLSVLLQSQIAHAYSRLGDFAQSEKIYRQAIDAARDKQGNLVPIAGEALMGLGDLLREQNLLDQANDVIMDGIELTFQWRKAAAIEGYLFLARVKQLENNWLDANSALDKAMALAVEYDALDLDDRMVAMWQARLWCFEEKEKLVESWINQTDLEGEVGQIITDGAFDLESYLLAREKIVQARYYLLKTRYEDALELADQLLQAFESYGRIDLAIELHLLIAIIHYRMQQFQAAVGFFSKAVDLGEVGGFVGLFLECGSEMKEIISLYEKRSGKTPYTQRLLAAFLQSQGERQVVDQPLIEPLSDRELDVLRYLPSNLTTPEIADEMMISINTVRTHIKNIYQKLGVHKRSEAVRRAQDVKFLR